MATSITVEQLNQYRNIINTKGVEGAKEVYLALYSKGYNYAGWAHGVASGETLTGRYALDYLAGSALMGLGGDSCRNLSDAEINTIRIDMANGYLNVLTLNATNNNGIINQDINFKETKQFHQTVFKKNSLTNDNWTLETPMEMMRQEFGDAYVESLWQKLRDTGGDYADSFAVTAKEIMAYMAGKAFGDGNVEAKEWFKIVVGPGLAPVIEKMWELRFELEKSYPNSSLPISPHPHPAIHSRSI